MLIVTFTIGNKFYQMQRLADNNFVVDKFEFNAPTDSIYISKYKDHVGGINIPLYSGAIMAAS